RIEVLGEGDFRLRTDALPFPLLVTSGQVGPKVQRLVELLPELSRRYPQIETVDLRFSRRIVVQPGRTGSGRQLLREGLLWPKQNRTTSLSTSGPPRWGCSSASATTRAASKWSARA